MADIHEYNYTVFRNNKTHKYVWLLMLPSQISLFLSLASSSFSFFIPICLVFIFYLIHFSQLKDKTISWLFFVIKIFKRIYRFFAECLQK